MDTTFDLMTKAHDGNEVSMLSLIQRFTPLLKKYAYYLNYEDAYNDLLLDFLIVIKNISLNKIDDLNDGRIVNYISKSIRNSYIRKSKSMKNYRDKNLLFCDLNEDQQIVVDSLLSETDDYFGDSCELSWKNLSQFELSVIYMIYYLGYTASDLARKKNVSRQAINQTKRNALKKLKRLYIAS